MLIAGAFEVVVVTAAAVVVGGAIGLWLLSRCVKIVQQGSVGVVKRVGEFRAVMQPGLHVLTPFIDRMEKVDVREFPQTGDQQSVITKDNVSLQVSATIFCQVIDVKSALFEINDFQLAVDQLSRTALRAVFGELSLDQALSEREMINSRMQDHMADATAKWGVRLNRIEILDITPPMNVIQAMSEQKEAEQHKRAAILKSEGEQQAAVNQAGGRKQAAVLEAEGAKQGAILRAEAEMKVLELQAEGQKRALELRGAGEAARLTAIDTATINPNTLAVLQLRALQDIATSDSAKVVVPYEATSLMGAAEVLLSALRNDNPSLNGQAAQAAQSAEQRNGASKANTNPPPPAGI
jgi:regulator of protease activity HflC (stomatin/prohibitin superfamily)